jgi:oxygen-independent coproporphyrinogen-3 oxidase
MAHPATALYLHIPFCRRRCFYCDFAITTGGEDLKEKYITALIHELRLTAAIDPNPEPLQTVFFGGGTPSLLSVAQLERILDAVATYFPIAKGAEISLEANPGTVTTESLRGYRALGVNRISLGAQSFQQNFLDLCGRGHSVAEIFAAVDSIAAAGLDNWSIDLISGLPHQTLDQWHQDLTAAIALGPRHISVYDLIIENGTAFGKRYQPGDAPLPSDDLTVTMYHGTHDRLTAAGFAHYEISNYAQTGYECAHNLTYWHNQDFYGVGMGATSYRHQRRLDRPRKMREYFEMITAWQDSGIAPHAPLLPEPEILLDTLMQGLRLAQGVPWSSLAGKYAPELLTKVTQTLAPYIDQGWVMPFDLGSDVISDPTANTPTANNPTANSPTGKSLTNQSLRLTVPTGWLFSNEVLTDLYAALLP